MGEKQIKKRKKMLRVARGSDPNANYLRVVEYNSNGAVRTEHAFARGARGVVVYIWCEVQLTEMKALPIDFNAAALADALLLTSNVAFSALSECSILKRLAELAFPLRFRLRAVMHAYEPDRVVSAPIEYARLIGGRTIILSARYDDDVLRATALDLAARLHDSLKIGNDARPFDTDGVLEQPVHGLSVLPLENVGRLPVTSEELRRLHAAGVFDDTDDDDDHLCSDGFLMFDAKTRTKRLILPSDATNAGLLTLLTRVLVIGDDERDCVADRIRIEEDFVHRQACSEARSFDTLVVYRLERVHDGAIVLDRAREEAHVPCAMLRSVDDLMSVDVSFDPLRVRSELLSGFEALRARVAARGDAPVLAALREVQTRRLAKCWTLKDIDAGGAALSSFGLSVLMGLVLKSAGARIRVLVSTNGGASLSVWCGDGFHHFNPARTAAGWVASMAIEAPRTMTSRGDFVEVLLRRQWQPCRVASIDRCRDVLVCHLLRGGRRLVLPLSSRAHRPVARDEHCDINRLLKSFVGRSTKPTASLRALH